MRRRLLPEAAGAVLAVALLGFVLASCARRDTTRASMARWQQTHDAWWQRYDAGEPVHSKIRIPPATYVYVQFQGNEMRMATSVAGLEMAQPVTGAKGTDRASDILIFPEVTLPVPAGDLPSGYTEVRARLLLGPQRYGFFSGAEGPLDVREVYGTISPYLKDSQGSLWAYAFYITWPLLTDPGEQYTQVLPNPTDFRLVVEPKAEQRQVGVGLDMTAGRVGFCAIRREGREVGVRVVVRDPKGHVMASKRGLLSDFTFG
jgi:hypothetical protein